MANPAIGNAPKIFTADQAARIGELGAGRPWGAMLARTSLPTTMPEERFGGLTGPSGPSSDRNPILTALGQTTTGGTSGLAAGIGRYRPPQAMAPAGSFQNQIFNGLMGRMNVPTGGLAPQQAARPAADGRSFGANPGANQMLAQALPGFTGDFGGGRFNEYMQGASQSEQMTAANILRALGQGDRVSWRVPAPPAYSPVGPVMAGNSDQGTGTSPVAQGIGGNFDPYLENLGVLQGGA